MDLYLFRLSMQPREQLLDLFEVNNLPLTRERWIRLFFSNSRKFTHRNSEFEYMPQLGVDEPGSERFIFGWVARATKTKKRTPPEVGLAPMERTSWQAAFLVIDPTGHADGPKVALEYSQQIGAPAAIISSLIKSFNAAQAAPYSTEVFPIVEEASFWRFAESHNQLIRSITFDTVVPNMFNDASDFQAEMRSLRDNENVDRVRTTLESETSLNHTTARIREIVDYTERGAGKLSAVSTDGETYNSDKHAKHIVLDVPQPNKGMQEFLRQIGRMLTRIFP